MRNDSHKPRKTVIAMVRDALDSWRKVNRWSQSTAVEEVVQAHHAIGADVSTEILFEDARAGRDEIARQKVNAERVYRWLDEDKSHNLLPANFLPSVLAALPMDSRVELANDILAPCGLAVRAIQPGEQSGFNPMEHLGALLTEFPQAKQALMKMASCDSHETALAAMRELDDAIGVAKAARAGIESHIAHAGLRSVA